MKKTFIYLATSLFIFSGITSCNSDAGKKIKETKDQIENVASIAQNASKIEKNAKDMEARMEELKKIVPFNSDKFKKWMPEKLGQFTRTSYEFQNIMGCNGLLKFSNKDAENEKTLEVSIFDGAGEAGSAIYASYAMLSGLVGSVESETESSIERIVERNGKIAKETIHKESNNCEIMTIISDRFLVNIEAEGIDIDEAWKLLDELKVKDLE